MERRRRCTNSSASPTVLPPGWDLSLACSSRTCSSKGQPMDASSATGMSPRTTASAATFHNSIEAPMFSSASGPAAGSARRRLRGAVVALGVAAALLQTTRAIPAPAVDVSPAPILQWFESTYRTIEERLPDVFMAGYGFV